MRPCSEFPLRSIFAISFVTLILVSSSWASGRETIIHHFQNTDGAESFSSLISDSHGNLYGTTFKGGLTGAVDGPGGVVFELSPGLDGIWTEKVLYGFKGYPDGANPYSGMIFDQAGNLYGSTFWGGANNGGTVYKLSPGTNGTWTEKVIYSFGSFGNPLGNLVFDKHGNLYGESWGSCVCKIGQVWQLTPQSDGSWAYSAAYAFSGTPDGSTPRGGLIIDSTGISTAPHNGAAPPTTELFSN